jgi:hypothetical protein
MGGLLSGLGGICALASFVCWIIILIAAFKEETVKGLLCLCVPFYILYYAFTGFKHEKKGLIIGVSLGGVVLGGILQVVGAAMAVADAAAVAS